MARMKARGGGRLNPLLKILIVAAVTVLALALFVYAGLLILARCSGDVFSQRMCATMQENGLFCTDWFFTTDEIRRSVFCEIPAEAAGLPVPRAEAFLSEFGLLADGLHGFVCAVDSSSLALGHSGAAAADDSIRIGLAAVPPMAFFGDCLYYAGLGSDDYAAFCGMSADGVLHIGKTTPAKAVNAGYVWGFSAERVLISGGRPTADLRGGYGSRAAIGQREDGTVILLVVAAFPADMREHPFGITYDTLAALMYSYGAVNAAALPAAGECSWPEAGASFRLRGNAGYQLTALPVKPEVVQ